MLKKVRVENSGTTELLPGQLVDKVVLERENTRVKKEKGEQATFEPLILGITKASLATSPSSRPPPSRRRQRCSRTRRSRARPTGCSAEGERDHRQADPAATGLKRYRGIEIKPPEKVPAGAYARPETEAELLAALEEIGTDGGNGLDLGSLGIDFGGEPGAESTSSHEAGEAEEDPRRSTPRWTMYAPRTDCRHDREGRGGRGPRRLQAIRAT
jgi:DNA-directed RNA polymerase subunit beta'